MGLYRLFKQFGDNEALLSLVMQYYDLVAEYDGLYMRLVQLRSLRDEKADLLNRLI